MGPDLTPEHLDFLVGKALSTSDDELLKVLGECVADCQLGLSPIDIPALIKMGNEYLLEIFNRCRRELCGSPARQWLNNADKTDTRKAAFALADIIAKQYGMPPAICASVLLSRGLLNAWCSAGGL